MSWTNSTHVEGRGRRPSSCSFFDPGQPGRHATICCFDFDVDQPRRERFVPWTISTSPRAGIAPVPGSGTTVKEPPVIVTSNWIVSCSTSPPAVPVDDPTKVLWIVAAWAAEVDKANANDGKKDACALHTQKVATTRVEVVKISRAWTESFESPVCGLFCPGPLGAAIQDSR